MAQTVSYFKTLGHVLPLSCLQCRYTWGSSDNATHGSERDMFVQVVSVRGDSEVANLCTDISVSLLIHLFICLLCNDASTALAGTGVTL
jgi:hypothetical protein